MNILITGGNGYIAKSLASELKKHHKVTTVTRSDFDITDSKQTNEWFQGKHFDALVHAAIMGGSRLQADDSSILEMNLRMHYNLVANRDRFQKLISFGSGAEIFAPDTPYGLSKRMIANSIRQTENWYNIRIYGVFDENELPTRFIKSNIDRYLRREPIKVHRNRVMDFFYMQDLISIVKHYLDSQSLPKEIDCSYEKKQTLIDIAQLINQLDEYRVPIEVEQSGVSLYCGDASKLDLSLVGFQQGLLNTFNSLKKRFNEVTQ